MTNCDDDKKRTSLMVVPEGGLWEAQQVAEYLKCSTRWVYAQVRKNAGFPFVEFGERNYRFKPAAVRAWVEARSKGGVTEQTEQEG